MMKWGILMHIFILFFFPMDVISQKEIFVYKETPTNPLLTKELQADVDSQQSCGHYWRYLLNSTLNMLCTQFQYTFESIWYATFRDVFVSLVFHWVVYLTTYELSWFIKCMQCINNQSLLVLPYVVLMIDEHQSNF